MRHSAIGRVPLHDAVIRRSSDERIYQISIAMILSAGVRFGSTKSWRRLAPEEWVKCGKLAT
jgi:hypothetical protein